MLTLKNNKLYNELGGEVVEKGSFKGYHYYITTQGSHPCAYVEDKFGVDFEDSRLSQLDIHGGCTYIGNLNWDLKRSYIGWDYAHDGDFLYHPKAIYESLKKSGLLNRRKEHIWTLDEVKKDIKRVINNMCKLSKSSKLLDSAERNYLNKVLNLLKMCPNISIETIRKEAGIFSNQARIKIMYWLLDKNGTCTGSFSSVALPYFDSSTMYKGLVDNHPYTLKELGL